MARQAPPGWARKILHAGLTAGDGVVEGCDAMPGEYKKPQSFCVMLRPKNAAEADRIFNALAEKGTVQMPSSYWMALRGGTIRTLVQKLVLSVTVVVSFGMPACTQKHIKVPGAGVPRVPERLRIAQVASGDQRRALFEGLLRDYEPEIRIAAAEELNRIGSAQSIAPLVDALNDGDIFVRTESHRALMHIGQPAIEAMLSRVSSKDYRYRPTLAALLLASITPETEQFLPKELLEDILRETRFVRCLGVLCVERVTVPSYPPLAKMARVSGEVFVEFSIKDGHPEDITTFGHPLLIETVVNALNHYQFAPENTRERYHITVKFDVIGSSDQAGTTAYDFVFPNSDL